MLLQCTLHHAHILCTTSIRPTIPALCLHTLVRRQEQPLLTLQPINLPATQPQTQFIRLQTTVNLPLHLEGGGGGRVTKESFDHGSFSPEGHHGLGFTVYSYQPGLTKKDTLIIDFGLLPNWGRKILSFIGEQCQWSSSYSAYLVAIHDWLVTHSCLCNP